MLDSLSINLRLMLLLFVIPFIVIVFGMVYKELPLMQRGFAVNESYNYRLEKNEVVLGVDLLRIKKEADVNLCLFNHITNTYPTTLLSNNGIDIYKEYLIDFNEEVEGIGKVSYIKILN